MEIKNKITKMIERSKFAQSICFRFYNRVVGDAKMLKVQGIRIRKNCFYIKGKENNIIGEKVGGITNNIVRIEGMKNTIIFGDNSDINGEHKQSFYIKGNNNTIQIDSNCSVRDTSFFISGDNNIIHIEEQCSSMSVEFHVEQNENVIYVGKGTTMHGRGMRSIHIAVDEGTKVDIGKDCMFSNDIQIRTSDSHSILDLEGNRLNNAKDVVIGNHCWIGLGCILAKGTRLGNYTVVGAGSVCTREIGCQHVIVAGNPAKIIKSGINWDRKLYHTKTKSNSNGVIK